MNEPSVPLLATLALVSTGVALRLVTNGRERLSPRYLGIHPLVGRSRRRQPVDTSPRSLADWEALVVSSQTHVHRFGRRLLPRLELLNELAGPDGRSDPTWIRLEQAAAAGRPLDLDDLKDWLTSLDQVS